MSFILKTITDRVTLAPLDNKDYSFNIWELFRISLFSAAILKNAVYLQSHVRCPFQWIHLASGHRCILGLVKLLVFTS